MYMHDWITKLDDFLRLSERDILTYTGKVSHDKAIRKARTEFEAFRAQRADLPSPVEKHFFDAIEDVKKLEAEKKGHQKRNK